MIIFELYRKVLNLGRQFRVSLFVHHTTQWMGSMEGVPSGSNHIGDYEFQLEYAAATECMQVLYTYPLR